MSQNVFVIDNGSHTSKAGFCGKTCSSVPNFVGRSKSDRLFYIADGISECKDPSSLQLSSPFEKGYLVNWDVQKDVWDRLFTIHSVKPAETDLVLTQPPVNPTTLQKMMGEVIFEEYGFRSLFSSTASYLCQYGHTSGDIFPGYGVIVDSGHSFTHIIPFSNWDTVTSGIKRINVGGKLLTNYLKEIISYRYWNMMEETILVNRIKERVCYVSLDFETEIQLCRGRHSKMKREYVLPDYKTTTFGYVKNVDPEPEPKADEEQILPLSNERITIPELLFHPSDIGIPQAGIAEAIVQAVESTPPELHGLLYANIILVGGNASFENYKQRVEMDLRPLVPEIYPINIHQPTNPINYAWDSAEKFFQARPLQKFAVSKAEYEEHGTSLFTRRFYN